MFDPSRINKFLSDGDINGLLKYVFIDSRAPKVHADSYSQQLLFLLFQQKNTQAIEICSRNMHSAVLQKRAVLLYSVLKGNFYDRKFSANIFDENFYKAVYQYAQKNITNKRYKIAADALRFLQLIPSQHYKATIVLAQAEANLNRYKQSVELLNKLCHEYPKDYIANYNLALYNYELGNFSQAKTILETLAQYVELREEALGLLADICLQNCDEAKCLAYAEAAFNTAKNKGFYANKLADLKWELNKSDWDSHFAQIASTIDGFYDHTSKIISSGDLKKGAFYVVNIPASFKNSIHHSLLKCELYSASSHPKEGIEWLNYLKAQRQLSDYECEWLGRFYLQVSKYIEAKETLSSLLLRNPNNQGYLCLLSTAVRIIDKSEYYRLFFRKELVQSLTPLSNELHDLLSLNKSVVEIANGFHNIERQPLKQSVVSGTQTRFNIFNLDNGNIQELKRRIIRRVDIFLASLQRDDKHPTLKFVGRPWKIHSAWSVRLEKGGNHKNHYHSNGWFSAVYYLDIPEFNNDEGALTIGEPATELQLNLEKHESIAPKVGNLVIFPSYMWHGTTPFSSNGYRMTIAFDIVPIYRD